MFVLNPLLRGHPGSTPEPNICIIYYNQNIILIKKETEKSLGVINVCIVFVLHCMCI